jgi:hypothetical protein
VRARGRRPVDAAVLEGLGPPAGGGGVPRPDRVAERTGLAGQRVVGDRQRSQDGVRPGRRVDVDATAGEALTPAAVHRRVQPGGGLAERAVLGPQLPPQGVDRTGHRELGAAPPVGEDPPEVPVAVGGAAVAGRVHVGQRRRVGLVGRVDVQPGRRLVLDEHRARAAGGVGVPLDRVDPPGLVRVARRVGGVPAVLRGRLVDLVEEPVVLGVAGSGVRATETGGAAVVGLRRGGAGDQARLLLEQDQQHPWVDPAGLGDVPDDVGRGLVGNAEVLAAQGVGRAGPGVLVVVLQAG